MSDYVNIVSAVQEFEYEMTKGDQAKEDMVMMMQPFNRMEEQLSAAPFCLSILGQLCLVATGKDFSLTDSKDSMVTFKHLTHPDSFRASLCQVSNEGYLAFQEADRVMDVIRLSTYQIPGLMTQSLNILFRASPQEVERHLPISLRRIQEVAQKCTTEAEQVVKMYKMVIDTLHELQVASLSKQGKTEEAKRVADFEAEQKKAEKEAIEQMKVKIDKNCDQLQKQMEEAQQEYKTALQEMPGAWSLVGLSLTESVCSTVLPALSIASVAGIAGVALSTCEFMTTMGGLAYAAKTMMGSQASSAAQDGIEHLSEEEAKANLSTSDTMLYSHAQVVNDTITKMEAFFDENDEGDVILNDEIIQGKTPPPRVFYSALELVNFLTIKSKGIKEEKLKDGNKMLAHNLMKICNNAKTLAKKIQKASEKGGATTEEVMPLKDKYDVLSATIEEIATMQCAARLYAATVQKKGPGLMQKAKALKDSMFGGGGTGKKSLVESQLQSAHVKIEITKEHLRSTEKRADEVMEKQLETNHRLQQNLMRIASFEAESAKHAEVMEVLHEGLKAFGELKEQWTRLLAFFQMMTNLINVSLGPPMKGFLEHAKVAGQDRQNGFEPSDFCKELIYQPAYEAVKVAYLVHSLSGTYCEISRDHMMPLVSRLGTLIALDKSKDQEKIRNERRELEANATKMQKTIEGIIRENNVKLHKQLVQRSAQLENAFKSKVPEIAQEKKERIQQDVKVAMQQANAYAQIEEINFEDYA